MVSIHLNDAGRCSGRPGNGWHILWVAALVLASHITLSFQYIKLMSLTRVFSIAEFLLAEYLPDTKVVLKCGELPMRIISFALLAQSEVVLRERAISNNAQNSYK
jgi:hypothetical protein